MCGIAGIISQQNIEPNRFRHCLQVMNDLQGHRGPDGNTTWVSDHKTVGFGHVRLSIIDVALGDQPMSDYLGNTICFNGEIYNYKQLRTELKSDYNFKTNSDTEVILAAYAKWGEKCVEQLRGMFAFAIYNSKTESVFCARDRFGIKPFYYYQNEGSFYFASEVKTLLPFVKEIETNSEALNEYLFFQLGLSYDTLFKDINQLMPAHTLSIDNGKTSFNKYWEVFYNLDFTHRAEYFEEKLQYLLEDSVTAHTVSDVPIGSYISGGLDSSIIAAVANQNKSMPDALLGFIGKFGEGELYDESMFARKLAEQENIQLHEGLINENNFVQNIEKVIYHLDYPVAGPGSFPQYEISELAAKHRKVVLGGQGGDEIFGGYTRYLIAYFEQCIKGAIDNTLHSGNFVVTYESIIPNLVALKNYKPLMKKFFSKGMFEPLDSRYFHLLNRAPDLRSEVNWNEIPKTNPFTRFQKIFNGDNVGKDSYFDKMTHFDFKTLLPALLQVEDRMSMAHGLESRVPFLDHPLVEFAATIPADIKFKNGTLKMTLQNAMKHKLPSEIVNRKDKMGFPVPLNQWLKKGPVKDYVVDVFSTQQAKTRQYWNSNKIVEGLIDQNAFGRKAWGFLSLELWMRNFHDQQSNYKKLIN